MQSISLRPYYVPSSACLWFSLYDRKEGASFTLLLSPFLNLSIICSLGSEREPDLRCSFPADTATPYRPSGAPGGYLSPGERERNSNPWAPGLLPQIDSEERCCLAPAQRNTKCGMQGTESQMLK
jgi:hypothetical protein